MTLIDGILNSNLFYIERFLLRAARTKHLHILFDYQKRVIYFTREYATDLIGSLSADFKKATLNDVLVKLCDIHLALCSNRESQKRTEKAQLLQKLSLNLPKEFQESVNRKKIIETRKEELERIQLQKERDENKARALKLQVEQENEKIRLADEYRKRELERIRREKEEMEKEEAKRMLNSMKAALEAKGKRIDLDSLEGLDKKEILLRQMQQLDEAKKQMDTRLKAISKKMDYYERAVRSQEIPLLEKEVLIQNELDEKCFNERQERRLENAKTKFENELFLKTRFRSMINDISQFKNSIGSKRNEIYFKKQEENQALLLEAKENRYEQQLETAIKQAEEAKRKEEQQRLLEEEKQRNKLEQEKQKQLQQQQQQQQQEQFNKQEVEIVKAPQEPKPEKFIPKWKQQQQQQSDIPLKSSFSPDPSTTNSSNMPSAFSSKKKTFGSSNTSSSNQNWR